MTRFRIALFAFVALLLGGPGMVLADEVLLRNGDRLTGDIVKMSDGSLVLKTPYAG